MSLAEKGRLLDPEDLAEEIIENIEAGLNSFRQIAASWGEMVHPSSESVVVNFEEPSILIRKVLGGVVY